MVQFDFPELTDRQTSIATAQLLRTIRINGIESLTELLRTLQSQAIVIKLQLR